jgi:hypothetical protein
VKKTLLYRLFGAGSIPKELLPTLEQEGIVIADEGMGGWLIYKNVKGPHKRYHYRAEGFSGCLVITKKRVICYTYRRRQISLAIDDPNISELYFENPEENLLVIAFEASVFRSDWQGVMKFRFKTEKAEQFCNALRGIGAKQGSPED